MASLLAGIPYPQTPDYGASFDAGRNSIWDAQRQQRADLRDKNALIAQYAASADTPEKWTAAMGELQRNGVSDAGQFAGRFDLRDQIIQRAYSAADQMNSQTAGKFLSSLDQGQSPQGANLSPGYLSSLGAAPPVGSVQTRTLSADTGDVVGDGKLPSDMVKKESGGKQFDSNGQPLTSSAGAIGIAQVMPSTGPEAAKLAGVAWDPVRFRNDAAYNEQLGAAYYDSLLRKYGDPSLARAAYNAGPGRVDQYLNDGRPLPAETVAYAGIGGGGLPNQVRPGTFSIQAPLNNGVPMRSLQVLAQNPTYAGTAIQTAIAQNVPIRDRYAVVGNAVFDKLTGRIVSTDPSIMKPTNDMQEYRAAQAQGYPGTFMDYQLQIKRAGTPTTESTYDQTMGKNLADTNLGIMQGAQKARSTLNTIGAMQQALSDPSVTQGSFGNMALAMKRNAQALGFDVGNLGPSELAQSLGNQLALTLRDPSSGAGMPGAMSDADRQFLMASVPGLSQTPQGNQTLLEYMRRVNQRAIDVDTLRQQYIRQYGRLDEGFYRALAGWSQDNPMFPEAGGVNVPGSQPDQSQAAAPQQATPASGYPEGTIIRGPNGQRKIRQNGAWMPYGE